MKENDSVKINYEPRTKRKPFQCL